MKLASGKSLCRVISSVYINRTTDYLLSISVNMKQMFTSSVIKHPEGTDGVQ